MSVHCKAKIKYMSVYGHLIPTYPKIGCDNDGKFCDLWYLMKQNRSIKGMEDI